MLERFAAQGGDAAASPHVTVRGAAQLRRAARAGRAGKRGGHHARERGLVQVRLQARAVRRKTVGKAHGVGRRRTPQAALRQRLRHARLAAERRRQLQLRNAGHSRCGPAPVVGVERAQAVSHSGRRKLRQTVCGQQRARSPEHVRRLLALLPLGPTVLKPHLRRKTNHNELEYNRLLIQKQKQHLCFQESGWKPINTKILHSSITEREPVTGIFKKSNTFSLRRITIRTL